MNNKAKIDCVNHESRTNETAPSVAVESVSVEKRQGLFEERPLPVIEIAPRVLRYRTRRDFLLFGAGAMAALAGGGFLLPQDTLRRMGVRRTVNSPAKEWFLNRALRIDDDVAEALYSGNRRVPTYTKSQITPLKNNYNGATPDPGYISGWNLTLDGLDSGDRTPSFNANQPCNLIPHGEPSHQIPNIERDAQAGIEPVYSEVPSGNVAWITSRSVVVVLERGNLRFGVCRDSTIS